MQTSKYQLRTTEQSISLELTPLIDVVFLLLIFFMLSTNFDETQWLDLQLPRLDDGVKHENFKDPFVIGIDPEGHFLMNKKELGAQTQDQLKAYLNKELTEKSIVVIHGDAKAPHESLVQLLSVLGDLKIQQLHIAALEEK